MNAEQQLLALREAAKKHPNRRLSAAVAKMDADARTNQLREEIEYRRHKTPNEVALSRAIRPFQEFVANLLGRV